MFSCCIFVLPRVLTNTGNEHICLNHTWLEHFSKAGALCWTIITLWSNIKSPLLFFCVLLMSNTWHLALKADEGDLSKMSWPLVNKGKTGGQAVHLWQICLYLSHEKRKNSSLKSLIRPAVTCIDWCNSVAQTNQSTDWLALISLILCDRSMQSYPQILSTYCKGLKISHCPILLFRDIGLTDRSSLNFSFIFESTRLCR